MPKISTCTSRIFLLTDCKLPQSTHTPFKKIDFVTHSTFSTVLSIRRKKSAGLSHYMEHIAEVLNLTCGTAYRLCSSDRRLIACSILRTRQADRESVSEKF